MMQNEELQDQLSLNDILVEKVQAFNSLIETQSKCTVDQYMIGLYNGLVLGRSVLTGEEPVFYEQQLKEE